MSNKLYIFGCGCQNSNYLTNHHNGHSVGKFCPDCFDPRQKYGARHNQRCRIVRLETGCEKCGAKIIKQSNEIGNIKHFLCPNCRRESHLELMRQIKAKKKLEKALNSLNPPVCVDGKIVVTCPRCRQTALKPPLTVHGHVQPKWQYCSYCRSVANNYSDGDNAIFAGRCNDVVVQGKAVVA